MPEAMAGLLETEGLAWLTLAALVAGMVRGFAGFGTAMIFLPVAGQFLSPVAAITVLIVKDLIGPLPNIPRALKDGHPGDVLRLAAGLLLAMPFGVWALTVFSPDMFRFGVSVVSLVLLALMVAGVRYTGTMTRPVIFGTGAVGGVLGGAVGVPGPPVIMLYMASTHPPRVIRANTTIYLWLADVVLLALLILFGEFVFGAVLLGLLMAIPYLLGNVIGAAIFRPGAERAYRLVAYVLIAASAVHGLPIFD